MSDKEKSIEYALAEVNASEKALDAYIQDNDANVTIDSWLEASSSHPPYDRKIQHLRMELDMARTIRQREPELARRLELPFADFKDPVAKRLLGDLLLSTTYWVDRADEDLLFHIGTQHLTSIAEALGLQDEDAMEQAMKNRDLGAAIAASQGFDAFAQAGAKDLSASQVLLRLLQHPTLFSNYS